MSMFFNFAPSSGGSPPGPITYAVWNSADKSSEIVLSAADRTASTTIPPTAWRSVRGTVGHTTGDRYFEVIVEGTAGGGSPYACVSLVSAAHPLSGFAGTGGALGWGIHTGGFSLYPGGYANDIGQIASSTRIGVAVLRSTSQVKFYTVVDATTLNLIYPFDISAADGVSMFPHTSHFTDTVSASTTICADPADILATTAPDSCTKGWGA